MSKKKTEELKTEDWNLEQKEKGKLSDEVPEANKVVTLPTYDHDDEYYDYDYYYDYYGGCDYGEY